MFIVDSWKYRNVENFSGKENNILKKLKYQPLFTEMEDVVEGYWTRQARGAGELDKGVEKLRVIPPEEDFALIAAHFFFYF
jgi:hypothetical protein